MGLKVWLGLYRKESAWIQLDALAPGEIRGRLDAQKHLLTPAVFLHTATIVALANTVCRYGRLHALPDGASGSASAPQRRPRCLTGW
jgi:acyl-coenzyme A thioesterase PaaI-like protein